MTDKTSTDAAASHGKPVKASRAPASASSASAAVPSGSFRLRTVVAPSRQLTLKFDLNLKEAVQQRNNLAHNRGPARVSTKTD